MRRLPNDAIGLIGEFFGRRTSVVLCKSDNLFTQLTRLKERVSKKVQDDEFDNARLLAYSSW